MFKSKRRPIIVPQSEHLRLVGTLALLWGNTDFDAPPVDRRSMVMGMGLHDRGYGLVDDCPIGGMTDEEWNPIARGGFYQACSDVVADTIVKYHIRRLAAHDEAPERRAMTEEFGRAIDAQLKENHLSAELFDRMDRITNLCDRISFDFCFDVPAEGDVAVFPRNAGSEETTVRYRVEDGIIHAAPWPFFVSSYQGYVTAYAAEGYPQRLDALILPYRLEGA